MSNMSDENRELVSALMDGEASEIEIHKLLQQYKLDEGHEGTGHTIRDTLLSFGRGTDAIGASRGGTTSVALDPEKHRVLHQAVSEAIAEDDTVFDAPLARRANAPLIRSRAFQASALAACLVVAVGLGITVMQTGMNSGGLFSDSPGVPQVASSGLSSSDGQVVNTQPVVASTSIQPALGEAEDREGLRELDEERQRELRAYLNRDGGARLDPNVQTVGTENTRNKED
ncbi:MAG: hypothetical protein CNE99_07630 [OM182 bacterium MED-G24]|uniref:Anti sigma-E protein RseA N-terminal domain-containing protein n=1 Tax=OM182 bacterium MED-G24 TaxID=1986255 RepID=A0A2A5WN72_9GAMM|nr:MAG: hypothetical protein CNE99_07630 [OM182 bacterium MED-G24]